MSSPNNQVRDAANDGKALARLSLLDWIGVLMVGASGVGGLLFPLFVAPIFRRLSDALGGPTPSGAASFLQGWTPALLGLLPVALVVYALAVPQSLGRRRLVLVLAFALTIVESVVLLWGTYSALFNAMGTGE
jgi:hypothetical protein